MSRAKGFKKARAKSKQRSKNLNQNVAGAIEKTVNEVHTAGRENMDAMVQKRSGKLRRGYRKRVSKKSLKGLVGYITASARQSTFYARFVHDGTSRAKAHPFHDTAVLEVEGRHNRRMKAALSDSLDDRSSPSGTGRTGGGIEKDIT